MKEFCLKKNWMSVRDELISICEPQPHLVGLGRANIGLRPVSSTSSSARSLPHSILMLQFSIESSYTRVICGRFSQIGSTRTGQTFNSAVCVIGS